MLSKDQISDVVCPVCGGTERRVLFELYDHEYHTTEQQFPMNQCAACSCHYLSPRPNEAAFSEIYPEHYSNFHTEETKESWVRRISNKRQSRRIKRFVDSYFGGDTISFLDIGCGDGFMLDRIKEVFPSAKTFGIEPSTVGAGIAARKHQVFQGRLEDYKSQMKFDFIMSSHVIEHVDDPIAFLRSIFDLLSPAGVAVIDTPNIDCFQYRLFQKHWGGFHSPRHWTLFSPETLRNASRRAGLSVTELTLCPINVFWVWSMHSWLYEKPKLRKLADHCFHPIECVSRPSLYYLGLLVFAEMLERASSFWGLGQMRCILRRKH